MLKYICIIIIFSSSLFAGITEASLYNFSKELVISGDYRLAEAQLEELIDTYPNSPSLLDYYLLLFQVEEKLGNTEKITRLGEAFIRRYPNHPKTPSLLIGIVERQISSGNLYAADNTLSQLETKFGDTPAGQLARIYRVKLILAKQGTGKAREALDNLPASIKGQYYNEVTLIKARVLIDSGSISEAYSLLSGIYKALKNEQAIEAGSLMVEALSGLKRYKEAEDLIQDLLKEYSTSIQYPQLLLSLGLLQYSTGNFTSSLETYRSFIKKYPYHPLAVRARLEGGKAAMKLGNYALALYLFEELQAQGSESQYSEEGHYYLIKAMQALGREEVKDELKTFRSLYPSSKYYSDLSSLETSSTSELGSLVYSFDISSIEPKLKKAIGLKESRRYDSAIEILSSLLTLPVNPLADWVVFELGESYRLQGDNMKAESNYRRLTTEMAASRFYPVAMSRLLYKGNSRNMKETLRELLPLASKGDFFALSNEIDKQIVDYKSAVNEVGSLQSSNEKAGYNLLAASLYLKEAIYTSCYNENANRNKLEAVRYVENLINLKAGSTFDISAGVIPIMLDADPGPAAALSRIETMMKLKPNEPYLAFYRLKKAEYLLRLWGKTSPDAIISLTEPYLNSREHKIEAYFRLGQYWNKYGEYNLSAKNLQKAVNSEGYSPFKAEAYFVLGETYYRLGTLAEAAGIYEKYMLEYPFGKDLLSAKARLADIYIKIGRLQRGLLIYQTMLAYSKGSRHYGDLLFEYAEALNEAGKPKDAYSKLKDALKENPSNKDKVYASLIKIAVATGRNDEARDYLKKLNPKSGDTEINRTMGVMNYDLGQYEAALSYFEKNKDDAESVAYQAICNMHLGRITKARRMIKFFKKYYPKDDNLLAKIKLQEALQILKTKNPRPAKPLLQSIISDSGADAETRQWAMLNLGGILRFEQDFEKAVSLFDKVMKEGVVDSLRIQAGFNLAEVMMDKNKLTDAKLIYNTLLAEARNSDHRKVILANLGLVSQQIGAWEEAIRYLQESLTLEKKDDAKAELFIQIGYCYQNMTQLRTALYFYRKAETTTTSNDIQKSVLINRGGAYQQNNDYSHALLNFLKLLHFYKEQDNTYYATNIMIGECYQSMGEIDKAKDYYEKAKNQKRFPDISKDADEHIKKIEAKEASPIYDDDPTAKPSTKKKRNR